MDHSRPPLRLDRAFFEDRNNQLKLAQMMTGAFALLLTSNCYPNRFVTYCAPQLFNFFQLFTAVCVNGFFLVATTLFALAHLFSIPDAFYHYNFPLLEKFYTTLATVMYAMGVCTTLVNAFNSLPSLVWIFQVGAICAASLTYLLDCWRRWKADSRTGRRTIT